MPSPRNTYKVPARRWARWSNLARGVFNETFRATTVGWENLAPPSLAKVGTKRARRILAFNAAWLAADEAQRGLRAMGWRRARKRLRVARAIGALAKLDARRAA